MPESATVRPWSAGKAGAHPARSSRTCRPWGLQFTASLTPHAVWCIRRAARRWNSDDDRRLRVAALTWPLVALAGIGGERAVAMTHEFTASHVHNAVGPQ